MSLLTQLKSFLPATSRSLHGMYKEMGEMHIELGQMHGHLGQMWSEVGLTRIWVSELKEQLAGLDARMMLTFWEGYRKEDESAEEARKRFFKTMGTARGGLRVFQLASAQLLSEFDAFCEAHGLHYSVVSGTILGAVRHQGFIPWDDDLDVGMPRADIERAIELVRDDPRYRITVRYDRCMLCKQVRFCYADETVPCFVDLFYYDYVKEASKATFAQREQVREALKDALAGDDELAAFWISEDPDHNFVEADTPEGALIASRFEQAVATLYAPDGPYTYDMDEAAGVILGIDNLDALVDHHDWYLVKREDIMPLQKIPFEGHPVSAPHHAWKCAEVHYGDLYELPKDIGIHFDHFSHDLLRDETTGAALRDLAQTSNV